MSRDQTVFCPNDDGRAYQFYSSENNETMYISLLTDDYLKPSGRFYTTIFHKKNPRERLRSGFKAIKANIIC